MNNDYGNLEAHKVILGMLKDIHQFCGENNIHYCLDGGSVLGAVRHDGFIPWDDDADIALKRSEFKKMWDLRDSFEGYRVETGVENAPWVFRIRPADDDEHQVDIFIYDNVPDDPSARDRKILRMAMMQGMLKKGSDGSRFSLKQRILLAGTRILGLPFSTDRKIKWYTKNSQIGNDVETRQINTFNSTYRALHRRFDADVLDRVMLHRFEDTELYIPVKYDHYLRVMYGDDYMTPPKEQYRSSHQGYLEDPDVDIPL